MIRSMQSVFKFLLLLILICLAPSSYAQTTINVNFKINLTGLIKSANNDVGYDHYNFAFYVTSTGVSTSQEGFTLSDGKLPTAFSLSGTANNVAVTTQVDGNKKVSFTLPLKVRVRRQASDPAFFYDSLVQNVLIEKIFPPTTAGVVTATDKTISNLSIAAAPPIVEASLNTVKDNAGFRVSLFAPFDVSGSTFPEFERLDLTLTNGASVVACAGSPTTSQTYSQTRGTKASTFNSILFVSGFNPTDSNKVRVCVKSRYSNTLTNGFEVANPPMGRTAFDAIRQVGLKPNNVAADALSLHPNGIFYNANGKKEKWFRRGAYSPLKWSYILPNSKLFIAAGSSINSTLDTVAADFGLFTVDGSSYTNALFVYDHYNLLLNDPVSITGADYLRELDRGLNLSAPIGGNYNVNFLKLNKYEKWFKGANGASSFWYTVEPNGLFSKCTAIVSGWTCTPLYIVHSSLYNEPTSQLVSFETKMDSLYKFYRVGTSDYLNSAGKNEKWFKSSVVKVGTTTADMWFYILPNGEVRKWDSNDKTTVGTTDQIVFTTSPTVYTDHLNQLVNLVP